MKELLRGESTISLEAAVLKCPNAGLYLFLPLMPTNWHLRLSHMFCWPCIVIRQYSRTNKKRFLYSLYYELTDSACFEHYLLICRRHCINNWYIASVLCRLELPADIIRTQYTNWSLCSTSWSSASSAWNMQKLLIHNKLDTNSASCWSYYTDTLTSLHFESKTFIFSVIFVCFNMLQARCSQLRKNVNVLRPSSPKHPGPKITHPAVL
jgi:hypothetical protein